MSFNHKTIEELHNLLVSKEISATELTQATLDDIKAREEAVNAFVTVAEEGALHKPRPLMKKGLMQITSYQDSTRRQRQYLNRWHLDNCGFKMLYNYEPIFDATAVANAKAKGMIVVGKTNMDEFAMGGSGETSYYGATKNAWDQTKVPGGSSSGSMQAVASGQVRLSLGSDTGGSIRQPVAFNGIVGLKPTYGTVSRFGLIAFGSSLDQIGPFAPTVKENALLLNAIASEDAKDSTSAPVRVADYTSKIGQDIKGMKIALPKEYLGEGIDPEVKETILNALSTLKNWEQLSKKSACLILNTELLSTTSSLHRKLLQTCNVLTGFVMVSVRKMLRTWMISMSTLVAKALVMKSNAGSCWVPLACHLVTTMPTTRKQDKSGPLLSKTLKSLCELRPHSWSNSSKCGL